MTRLAALTPAFELASAELMIARKINTQPPPQKTVASRVIYAMGRNRVLPAMFGETHPVHKTPHRAIEAQTALGILVALLLGWKWGPLNAFGVLSFALTSLVILVYMALCVAAFVPVLWYQFHPLAPYPLRYGNWGAIVLLGVSVLVTAYMATQRRERMDANLLFVAEAPGEEPPEATAVPTPV